VIEARETSVLGDTFTAVKQFSFPNGYHTDKHKSYVTLIHDR